jgi:hypothetical protein
VRDFTMGHIAGGVSSVFASFISHRSSAFFRVVHLFEFETQLTFFYILDPWFPATISSSFSYTLIADLGLVDSCLIQTR